MKMHSLNGYGVQYPYRGAWAAKLYESSRRKSRELRVIPVGWKRHTKGSQAVVHFNDIHKMAMHNDMCTQYVMAEAVAWNEDIDPTEVSYKFKAFTNLYLVQPTGKYDERLEKGKPVYDVPVQILSRLTRY